MRIHRLALSALIILMPLVAQRSAPRHGYRDWTIYGGGSDSIRYSSLRQINRNNVKLLKQAWSYETGDAMPGTEMQCNPIVVDGVMYGTSPKLTVFALDAATGKQLWSYRPALGGKATSRGVVHWASGKDRRIFFSVKHLLLALDARTGKPVPGFGKDGSVDMREGLGRDVASMNISARTPGIIYKDLLIMGSVTGETLPSPPGDIRAYDVRTGKLRWTFHTIPHPGEYGYETWPSNAWKYIGGANSWAGMSLDEKRGLVFVPTGSAAFDFFGGNRKGDNLFANSLLALKAGTGERVWHFQFVKHDVWDRDLMAPPNLVQVRRNGKLVDAVAQSTKSGHIFVLDRETGKPMFPMEEKAVPGSDADGEALASTQVLPVKPPAIARQVLTEDMLTARTPEARKAVLEAFRMLRNNGPWTPPSVEGSIVFPGFDGAGEWGGQAYDPETGLYYVNANEMAWILRLVEILHRDGPTSGRNLYNEHCAGCHRPDMAGTPPEFPSLAGIGSRRKPEEIATVIRRGAGRMPGFSGLDARSREAISKLLLTGEDEQLPARPRDMSPISQKYTIDGYNKFLDPDGYPAVTPPWGTLNAVNLDTGEIAWKIPFGEYPELVAKGMKNTGSENYGGPVVTAGGLLFIGATNHDRKFRAYDKVTGELLWETLLPAGGNATPAVYEVKGRQYVVIAAGGGKSGAASGGSYVAFALGPD
ncbi:MAG: PQQ-binding-like beta-propeller repeat protein [Acidobacteriia bacterium]|nr:PQQ-binding-like beta-propeller repeat protein [Terriglobia bacterium]